MFHTAGVGQGETVLKSDLGLLVDVLRPKVRGTWVLDRVLRGAPLDFFVLFSSATHQLGLLGQGTAAYSAASAFLDAFAHCRRSEGRTAVSIDWGPWSEVGMAAQSGNVARLRTFGIGPVSPRHGTEILGHALAVDTPQLVNLGRLGTAAPRRLQPRRLPILDGGDRRRRIAGGGRGGIGERRGVARGTPRAA